MAIRPGKVWNGTSWDDIGDARMLTHDHSGGANGASIPASSITATAWTTYTPTITSSANPQPSGWTQTGYYMRIGKKIEAHFSIVAPSANFGTTHYRIALPATAASTYPASGTFIGTIYFEDAGVAGYYGWANIGSSATYLTIVHASATIPKIANVVGPTAPFNFGAGDFINGQISYEAA